MKDVEQFESENPTNVPEENEGMPQCQFIVDNGSLIACHNSSSIYLVQRGHRHLIPNAKVYYALFVSHHLVHFIRKRQLDSIPLGIPLSENACLIKGNNTDHVYLSLIHICHRKSCHLTNFRPCLPMPPNRRSQFSVRHVLPSHPV